VKQLEHQSDRAARWPKTTRENVGHGCGCDQHLSKRSVVRATLKEQTYSPSSSKPDTY
jgi:hypothetical protein